VEVVEDDGTVRVTVRDDGGGFDTGKGSTGFGLLGMRERVELVDGRLSIESTPGRGTVVRAELPATRALGDGEASESGPRESAQG
jgi:signal transduction histidine kinase